MKIELMIEERMGVEGKGILRSLQNDSLPLVDLLIRESFQNSLDATKKGETSTLIDVGICDFEVISLAEKLDGLTQVLKTRYSNQPQKAITISDKNTIGLIGDVRRKKGNIYNLIYTVQKNQEEEGAGGSWGLGKTSYFRIGNGIVLYYSRIKLADNSYEERLAGSLIEDSTKADRLLDNDRGIAWWGQKDKCDDGDDYGHTYPLTNSKEIHEILEIFKIQPYVDEDTGTTIIIPFIDEKKVFPKYEDDKKRLRWWESDLKSAIEIAIQKWYSPRIWNLKYDGAYLRPSINGVDLLPHQFQPFFKQIHDLYVCGLGKVGKGNINVDTIKLNRLGIVSDEGVAGWVSYGLYGREDLRMTPPNNDPHPLEYFGYTEQEELENTNAKIVVYTRKPGMILEYDINSSWSKSIVPDDDKFLLAFFIPNGKGLLHEKFREPKVKTLEDYLRKTEKSDHAEWEDIELNTTKVTIVNRMKGNVSKAIQNMYSEDKDKAPQSKASLLGMKIGEKLLPKEGVGGEKPRRPSKKDGTGHGKKKKQMNVSLELSNVDVNEDDDLVVVFSLNIKANIVANVSVNLIAGNTRYDEERWRKDMGEVAQYPFIIKEIFIKKINEKIIQVSSDDLKDEKIAVYFTQFENQSSFKVKNKTEEDNLEIELKVSIKANDVLMQPSLEVSEVK